MISIFSVYVLPALVLAIIGALFGILIAIFSKYFFVEEDERVEELSKLLPGYNCGSCGCPGCKGFAEDIINNNNLELSRCKPLSKESKNKGARIFRIYKKIVLTHYFVLISLIIFCFSLNLKCVIINKL